MMKPTLDNPPRTLMEVYKSLPEGTLAELIQNELFMSPSPTYQHQDILIEIASTLRMQLKNKGKIVVAPFDVYLDEKENAVQPDITIILSDNNGFISDSGHFHGTPDIVIEILSKGNRDHDKVRKRALYERFEVKEYWMVDPENKLTTGLTLKNKKYELIDEQTGTINSPLLGVTISF